MNKQNLRAKSEAIEESGEEEEGYAPLDMNEIDYDGIEEEPEDQKFRTFIFWFTLNYVFCLSFCYYIRIQKY